MPSARERLIRGESGWWFLGPGGRARLGLDEVTAHRALTVSAERRLRDAGLFTEAAPTVYALTVLTSTSCNLGCAYCFQNLGQDLAGGHQPPRIAHVRLTSRAIADVLTFTSARMAAAGIDRLALMLFGGEPLLNPAGCTELLARAHDYGLVTASMTSNGTLLTPALARKLAALGLRTVQITFDGDRNDHDQVRVRRNGAATFDAILANMTSVCAETDLRWHVRVNVSERNVAGIPALLERLAAALDPSRCLFAPDLVGDVGIGYRNSVRAGEELARLFAIWHEYARRLGFGTVPPTAYPRCQACTYRDGRYGAVVNADGVLYSCWETAGRAGWHVGTVRDGYLDGVDARWISCRDLHRRDETAEQFRAFEDARDAAILDSLSAVG